MPIERQDSFAGGEFAPTLWGRTSFEKYAIGARTIRNFIPITHGALASRPGTRFVAATKNNAKVRLEAFVFSDDNTLLLAFGAEYIRFYTLDSTTGLPGIVEDSSGNVIEVTTPYAVGDLPYLSFSQVGDVISIACRGYPPRDLKRYSDTVWTLTETATAPTIEPPEQVLLFAAQCGITKDEWDHGSSTLYPKVWEWVVTAVDKDGNESAASVFLRPYPSATDDESLACALYSNASVKIAWSIVSTAAYYNIYRGRKQYWGLVGTVPAGMNETLSTYGAVACWTDYGDDPDFTKRPPSGKSPFTAEEWVPGTRYEAGDYVWCTAGISSTSQAHLYRCTVGGVSRATAGNTFIGPIHTSGEVSEATAAGSSDITAWAASTAYAAGVRVYNHGCVWESRITDGSSTKTSSAAADFGPFQPQRQDDIVYGTTTETGCMYSLDYNSGGSGDYVSGLWWKFLGYGTSNCTWEYVGLVDISTATSAPVVFAPRTVTHHEQRRAFAGSEMEPSRLWLSKTDQWSNFDIQSTLANSPLGVNLASRYHEEIRALLSREALFVFTSQAEWAIVGAGLGEAIQPNAVVAHALSDHGCAISPSPLGVGNEALWIDRSGAIPFAMVRGDNGGYGATNLSILSRHLFRGRTIVSWAYAERPWSIVWAVTSDGELLSLTWLREQQVAAWAHHDFGDDLVEEVCTVPEGTEDAVYLVVKRTVNGSTVRYIERMATRDLVTDAKTAVCLDCSLTYDGDAKGTFSGLDHLEGREVYAVADGYAIGPLTVSGGAITLPEEQLPDGASYVTVGLQYDCEFVSLDSPQERGKPKTVGRVWLEYESNRAAFVGEDLDHLTEWRQRKVSDGVAAIALETGNVEIPIKSTWNTHGRIAVRQRAPLPLTILGIQREVQYAG